MLQYQNRGALARETGLVTTQPHKDEALVAPRFCGVKLGSFELSESLKQISSAFFKTPFHVSCLIIILPSFQHMWCDHMRVLGYL